MAEKTPRARSPKYFETSTAETLIQHPETGDFLRGAMVEAAFQREKWPEQDKHKTDSDWFWTLGYIIGKGLRPDCTKEKLLHRIEAAAALLANWHHAVKARSEGADSPD